MAKKNTNTFGNSIKKSNELGSVFTGTGKGAVLRTQQVGWSPPLIQKKKTLCNSPISSSASSSDSDDISIISKKMKATKLRKQRNPQKKSSTAKSRFVLPKTLLKRAPKKYIVHLYESLHEEHQSLLTSKYGFGCGSLVETNNENWEKTDIEEMAEFLKKLGFSCSSDIKSGKHVVYSIANSKADVLLEALGELLPKKYAKAKDYQENIDPLIAENSVPDSKGRKVGFESLRNESFGGLSPVKSDDCQSSFQIEDAISPCNSSKNMDIEPLSNFNRRETLGPLGFSKWQSKRDRNRARRLSRAVMPLSSNDSGAIVSGGVSLPPLSSFKLTLASSIVKSLSGDVLALVLSSNFLSLQEVESVSKVCHKWQEMSHELYCWLLSDFNSQVIHKHWESLISTFPTGKFLADGAYKEVFQVYCNASDRQEAISVMNFGEIQDSGNEAIIRQEVYTSLLLSKLCKFCPNFLEIYQSFLFAHAPPKTSYWSQVGEDSEKKSHSESTGIYQYIRMDLCDGGDIEQFIRSEEILPIQEAVIPFFFQMVFAVYVGRAKHSMRHFDIKLLNFFLKKIDSGENGAVASYVFGDKTFYISMPSEYAYWVKLGDYGTALTSAETLGNNISADQFTTLENAPIDFFLIGDNAICDYGADTFALGLSMLHLFTGIAPYEELMANVECPPALLKALKSTWTKKDSPFKVIAETLRFDDENVMFHTFYRYLVLLGIPDAAEEKPNKVMDTVRRHLCNKKNKPLRKGAATTPSMQFESDHETYSLKTGSNYVISNARERLESVPGAFDILLSMLSFEAKDRPSMKSILLSPCFKALESDAATAVDYKFTGMTACENNDIPDL